MSIDALPWAEFISTIYRDEYYPPLDGSFRTPGYFRKIDLTDAKLSWEKTLALIREGKAPAEIGLYVHWPFCPSHCTFCRCSMMVPHTQKEMKLALKAVKEEMSELKKTFSGVYFASLYMGGGTPTFMTDAMLDDFLTHLRSCFQFSPKAQIYTESSPSTLTPSKINILARHGINRVTVGIQTFDANILKRIDRQGQTKEKIIDIFEAFARIPEMVTDVDLMIGMEGQTASVFAQDLKETLKLGPHCLHLYPFEDAPQTLFRKSGKKLEIQDFARESQLVKFTDQILGKAGYQRWNDDWNDLDLHPWETRQEAAWRRSRGSILGIGYSALSHAFGAAWYCHPTLPLAKPDSMPPFFSIDSNREEEMRGYLIEVLARSGKMSRGSFKRLFGEDPLNISCLAAPIFELKRMSFIRVDEQFVSWVGSDPVQRAVQLKRFYSPMVIGAILKSQAVAFRDFSKRFSEDKVDWRKLVAVDQAGHDTMAYYNTRFWGALRKPDEIHAIAS
jgi:coproporphyrinogen III oxidase-like Fe-S oxidoreductase